MRKKRTVCAQMCAQNFALTESRWRLALIQCVCCGFSREFRVRGGFGTSWSGAAELERNRVRLWE
jgi:hypothetical protein